MITIRRAAADDVPWLLEQLRAFDACYGTKRSLVPPDPAVAATIVASLVARCVFFVAERSSSWRAVGPHVDTTCTATDRVGFIAGVLTSHCFNPELRVLAELLWWVVPAHRGSSAGSRLLEHFLAHGRAHADWVTMTLESTSPIDDRVLRKRGFVPHERSLLLEV